MTDCHESEPRVSRLENFGSLDRFTALAVILVVRFALKKCPFGAENTHF
jgi:hypothetical protein